MKNHLLYKLLIDQFLMVTTDTSIFVGMFGDFDTHIDGGILLKNCYDITNNRYYDSIIVSKLCIKELGNTNFDTTIIIENDVIKLKHVNKITCIDYTTTIKILS